MSTWAHTYISMMSFPVKQLASPLTTSPSGQNANFKQKIIYKSTVRSSFCCNCMSVFLVLFWRPVIPYFLSYFISYVKALFAPTCVLLSYSSSVFLVCSPLHLWFGGFHLVPSHSLLTFFFFFYRFRLNKARFLFIRSVLSAFEFLNSKPYITEIPKLPWAH